MEEASVTVVRLYEIVGLLFFVITAIYVWRLKDSVYVGIFVAASIGAAVFEWIFDSKYFFRLTTSEHFIPAWTMDGVEAPLAMILFYAFMWAIPLTVISRNHERITGRIGTPALYGLLVAFALVGTTAFETLNTVGTGIYTYHQQDVYLMWGGMPWSNLWFAVLLLTGSYWAISQARRLSAGQPPHIRFWLGFAAVICGFFVATTVNGVWYVFADPWTATPRPF